MANGDRNLPSRLAPVITVVLLLLAGSLVPKGPGSTDAIRLARGKKASADTRERVAKRAPKVAFGGAVGDERRPSRTRELEVELPSKDRPDLTAYEDLGSWIDIYDEWPWAHPNRAVRVLHRRGVRTIFLQTSNWGADRAIFKPHQTEKFLKSAHRRDMKVVSWSVPSFAKPKEDYHRSRAAILFQRDGHRFDSFGLDIESTVVGDIGLRNRRLIHLSKRLRRLAGPRYTLGAITPDPVKALYWPDFPYERVTRFYDVFVPMGYFSFRTDSYRDVKKYTLASIRNIRRGSGDPNVPIHLIGGIGGETRVPEVRAFVRAVRGNDVLGGSYYDMTVTSDEEWAELQRIADAPEPAAPAPEPEVTHATEPEVRPTPLVAPEATEAKAKHDKKRSKKSNAKHDKKKSKKSKAKHDKQTSHKHRKRRNGNG